MRQCSPPANYQTLKTSLRFVKLAYSIMPYSEKMMKIIACEQQNMLASICTCSYEGLKAANCDYH